MSTIQSCEAKREYTPEMFEKGMKEMDKGIHLFKKHKYGQALRLFNSALSGFSKNLEVSARLHCEIAACYLHMPPVQYHNVISECSAALVIKPDYSRALVSRARGFIGLNKSEEAKRDLSRALEVDIEAIDAQNLLDELKEKEMKELQLKELKLKEKEMKEKELKEEKETTKKKGTGKKSKKKKISPSHISTEAEISTSAVLPPVLAQSAPVTTSPALNSLPLVHETIGSDPPSANPPNGDVTSKDTSLYLQKPESRAEEVAPLEENVTDSVCNRADVAPQILGPSVPEMLQVTPGAPGEDLPPEIPSLPTLSSSIHIQGSPDREAVAISSLTPAVNEPNVEVKGKNTCGSLKLREPQKEAEKVVPVVEIVTVIPGAAGEEQAAKTSPPSSGSSFHIRGSAESAAEATNPVPQVNDNMAVHFKSTQEDILEDMTNAERKVVPLLGETVEQNLGETCAVLEKAGSTPDANVKDMPLPGAKSGDDKFEWLMEKIKSIVFFCWV